MTELVYLNGSYGPLDDACLNVEDRGFLFGDGVYEVVKVLNGRPLWLAEHLERLGHSIAEVSLDFSWERHPLGDVVTEVVQKSRLATGVVYIEITRGVSPRDFSFPEGVEPTVVVFARSLAAPSEDEIHRGVTVQPLEDIRWQRCDIKSTSLLAAVLGKNQARAEGHDEALWFGPGKIVREGGSSNVFALVDGVLRTHPADIHILNGITRLNVLRLAPGVDVQVREEAFTLDQLYASDEAFLVSTTNDVMPIVQVGKRTIAHGRPGDVTLRVLNALRSEAAVLAGLDPIPPPPR